MTPAEAHRRLVLGIAQVASCGATAGAWIVGAPRLAVALLALATLGLVTVSRLRWKGEWWKGE